MLSSPCKDCEWRTSGDRLDSCHSGCEKYKEYRRAIEAAGKAKSEDCKFYEYLIESRVHVQKAKRW